MARKKGRKKRGHVGGHVATARKRVLSGLKKIREANNTLQAEGRKALHFLKT